MSQQEENSQIALAEAQLIGFMMASKGHSIDTLADEMGLTRDEWIVLRGKVNLKNSDVWSLDKKFGIETK